jgi:hypothetical protein
LNRSSLFTSSLAMMILRLVFVIIITSSHIKD